VATHAAEDDGLHPHLEERCGIREAAMPGREARRAASSQGMPVKRLLSDNPQSVAGGPGGRHLVEPITLSPVLLPLGASVGCDGGQPMLRDGGVLDESGIALGVQQSPLNMPLDGVAMHRGRNRRRDDRE